MFGFGGGRPQLREKETRLYDILEITPDADAATIKKAYKKMAMKYHPDKNPNAGDKFKEISMAYEILNDPQKKEVYDQYGEEGLKNGMGGMDGGMDGDPFSSIFSQFFGGGGGGGGRRERGPRKGEDVVHSVTVTLEDCYNGKVKTFALQKQVICSQCSGSGCKPGVSPAKCTECGGSGQRIAMRQIGPGMVQRAVVACPACHGRGDGVTDKDKCAGCKGNHTVVERKILEVHIDKGMIDDQKIVFNGESDQQPGVEPGDVIIIVKVDDHSEFVRRGADLIYKKTITLCEALTGCSFVINHLDKRKLFVTTTGGDVIKPGDYRCINGEGMPRHRNPFDFGNLYIQFEVTFPTTSTFTPNQTALLQKILPYQPQVERSKEMEECIMKDGAPGREDQSDGRREAYHEDDDDDDARGGPGVQCAQQ